MKRNIVSIILLLSLLPLSAQDTLEYGDLPYYYNNYYPTNCFRCLVSNCTHPGTHDTVACSCPCDLTIEPNPRIRVCTGHSYITQDTLKIYGIAATYDPGCDGIIEELPEVAVYQYEPDSAIRAQYYGASTVTELGRTRIMSRIRHYSYRANILVCTYDSYFNPTNIVRLDSDTVSVVPAFEYYFSSPIVVHDTFFVGAIQGSISQALKVNYGHVAYLNEGEATYGYATSIERYDDDTILHLIPWKRFEYGGFFPIIRPLRESDTTVNDSTAIAAVDYSRMVSLAPNPTDGHFTVTSDDELRAIVVYDMTGRAVMRRNASGNRAEIDASALPKGCYILAATTANGVARKKLILR